jgi:rod shape-determining protein MreD
MIRPSLLQRFDLWARWSLPFVTTLSMVLIGVVPTGLDHIAPIGPSLALMALFYWTVYRPDLLPPGAVFLIGVFRDILAGTPFGVSALVFLAFYGVTLIQRQAFLGKPFFLAWLGFVVIGTGAFVLECILLSVLALHPILSVDAVLQAFVTVVSFPLVAWGFVLIHRHMIG